MTGGVGVEQCERGGLIYAAHEGECGAGTVRNLAEYLLDLLLRAVHRDIGERGRKGAAGECSLRKRQSGAWCSEMGLGSFRNLTRTSGEEAVVSAGGGALGFRDGARFFEAFRHRSSP